MPMQWRPRPKKGNPCILTRLRRDDDSSGIIPSVNASAGAKTMRGLYGNLREMSFSKMFFALGSAIIIKVLTIIQAIGAAHQSADEQRPDGGIFFGRDHQDTSTPAAIARQAEMFLSATHLTGIRDGQSYSFNMPSQFKYSPSQWLWDSGAHQISWAALGHVDLAIQDMRSMLSHVLKDGRLPEQINWHSDETSRVEKIKTLALYSRVDYNDLTQSPVLPYSLKSIFNATGNVDLLREFVPKLVTYFTWLKDVRDLDGNGLVTILHPWESGLDLSPAYDAALQLASSRQARPAWRDLYPKLVRLNLAYKFKFKWDHTRILGRPSTDSKSLDWFKVHDVAFNCIYASGWGILADLAMHYDEALATKCRGHQEYAENGILANLFDHDRGHFVTGYKDLDNKQQYHPAKTVQILFPLLLSTISRKQIDDLVTLLTDKNEFWTENPIPSVSKAETSYNPIQNTELLWRGPTWGFPNWFIMEGLAKHGKEEVLKAMMDKWIMTVTKGGIYEMYNPDTAVGYGAEGLGMSCLVVDWMKRLGRI